MRVSSVCLLLAAELYSLVKSSFRKEARSAKRVVLKVTAVIPVMISVVLLLLELLGSSRLAATLRERRVAKTIAR